MWDINLIHMGLIEHWRAIVNAYCAYSTSVADGRVKSDFYKKLVAAMDLRNKIVDHLFIP